MTESTDEIRSEDERTMEEETEETEATATEVDLYAEFGLEKTATQAEIKKAYHKVALRFHPDKITAQGLNDEEVMQATQRFQRILKYYEILSDPTKRERYDQTGSIDDESYSLPPDAGSWGAYFRDLWSGIVNEETIAEFAKDYKESEEERKDILKAYNDYEGDFWKLYETVFLLEFDDVPRVIDTIKAAIDAGEIQKYKKFASTTTQREINKHRKAAEKEAKEAEEMLQEIRKTQKIKASKAKKGSGEELKALMQARSKDRFEAMFASIEEKYARPKSGGKKRKITPRDDGNVDEAIEDGDDMPPTLADDDFEAYQAKLFAERKKSGAASDIPSNATSRRKKKRT